MRKSVNKVLQHGVLGLGIICLEGHAMAADVDLIERGAAGIRASSVTVTDNQSDFSLNMTRVATESSLKFHFKNDTGGTRGEVELKGIPLCICLTSVCIVGGLSVLHLVGLI